MWFDAGAGRPRTTGQPCRSTYLTAILTGMPQQLTLKLPDEDLARLDQLIEAGRFPNRHAALRAAFERMLRAEAEALLDARIVAGYRRQPDGDDADLDALAAASARRSIADEPW
jgi:Arc/MetJ-type ribon-helix-helix transcriptional regulator